MKWKRKARGRGCMSTYWLVGNIVQRSIECITCSYELESYIHSPLVWMKIRTEVYENKIFNFLLYCRWLGERVVGPWQNVWRRLVRWKYRKSSVGLEVCMCFKECLHMCWERVPILYVFVSCQTIPTKRTCLGLKKSIYIYIVWICNNNPETPTLTALAETLAEAVHRCYSL